MSITTRRNLLAFFGFLILSFFVALSLFPLFATASEYPSGACFTTTERTTGYEVNIVIPPNVPICGSGGCTTSPFETVIATFVVTDQTYASIGDDSGVGRCGPSLNVVSASLTAIPSIIDAGNSSTLSWSSNNALYCSSSDFVTGSAVSGSIQDYPLSTKTYTVQCGLDPQNTSSSTATASATVTVRDSAPAPIVSLVATPNNIDRGETSVLSWNSENATSCTGAGFSTQGRVSGSVDIAPRDSRNYSITCSGAGGDAYDEAYVTVQHPGNPPTVSLTATPSIIDKGDSTTLSWTSSRAITCTGGGFATGGAVEGSVLVSPQNDVRYSISCSNSDGVAIDYADVTVNDGGTPGCVGPDCPCTGDGCGGTPGCTGENCGVETNFIASCVGSPAQGVPVGEVATWSANPRGEEYIYSWSGSESLTGSNSSVQKAYNQPGLKNASVTITRGAVTHNVQCQNELEVTAQSAVLNFTPLKNPIVSGDTATLNWSVQNVEAGTCSVVGPSVNKVNLNAGQSGNGAIETASIVSESSFTLRCLDLNGEQQSRAITIRVVPSFIEI